MTFTTEMTRRYHAPRRQPHESGLGECIIIEPNNPDSPVIVDERGEGLTVEAAERALDDLNNHIKRGWRGDDAGGSGDGLLGFAVQNLKGV